MLLTLMILTNQHVFTQLGCLPYSVNFLLLTKTPLGIPSRSFGEFAYFIVRPDIFSELENKSTAILDQPRGMFASETDKLNIQYYHFILITLIC